MMGTLGIGSRSYECPLAFGDNTEKRCAWCGEPLTGRARRWCSTEHGTMWFVNHCWSGARDAALARDGRKCTRCGATDGVGPDGMWRSARLEVNHIVPVLGKHGRNGCHHHIDGLETLCHDCHVQETARQFGYSTAIATDQLSLNDRVTPLENQNQT